MGTSREIVCREFKKQESLFLNYDSELRIDLGDVLTWNGRSAQFTRVTTLSDLQVPTKTQQSTVESDRLFNSHSGVAMSFRAKGRAEINNPTMSFRYRGSSRYSLQAYKAIVESIDEVALASEITRAIQGKELTWDKHWIVVTTVWNADAYTQLVSGGRNAQADICASSGSVTNAFNIADVSIGVTLGFCEELKSQLVASSGARPFFVGMKYREARGKTPHMARYG